MKHLNHFENFVASNAKLTKKKSRKLLQAKEMLLRNVDAETIRIATGWFQNPNDDKWRFENDSYALQTRTFMYGDEKYKVESYADAEIKLSDLISNTSLFVEYPDLKNIIVTLYHKGIMGQGHYANQDKKIGIEGVNMTFNKLRILEKDIPAYEYYETQEYRDKFPMTGRWGKVITYEDDYQKVKTSLNKMITERDELLAKPVIALTSEHKEVLLHEVQHAIQYIEKLPVGSSPSRYTEYELYDDKWNLTGKVTPYDQYLRNAGEIEAWEVGDRAKLGKKTQYVVLNAEEGDTLGFVQSFDTEEDANDFLRYNKEATTRSGTTVGVDQLTIKPLLSRKDKKPYADQKVARKDVIRRYGNAE